MRFSVACLSFFCAFGLHAQQRLTLESAVPVSYRHTVRFEPTGPHSWQFATIRSVAADGAGRVFVLDGREQLVRVFEADGRFVQTLGRPGSGPGEFRGARFVQVVGDTLWVMDAQNARITGYSTRRLALLPPTRRGPLPLRLESLTPTGVFHAIVDREEPATASAPRRWTVQHRAHSTQRDRPLLEYDVSTPVLTFLLYERGRVRQSDAAVGRTNMVQPFGDSPLWATRPNGLAFSLLFRNRVLSEPAGNPFASNRSRSLVHFVEVAPSGDTLRDLLLSVPARRLSDGDVRDVVDSLRSPLSPVLGRWVEGDPEEIRRALVRQRFWPAVTGYYVESDGTLWLRMPQPPGAIARYWRVSADLRTVRTVELPNDLRILLLDRGLVYGTRESSAGEPVVDVFRPIP